MNKIIRLTEQDLHNIVRESVNRILKEARSSEYETTAQQQERLNKKGGKRDFGKYGEKKAQEYETTAQQQERLKKKGLREGWADDLCNMMKGAPNSRKSTSTRKIRICCPQYGRINARGT